MITVRDKVTADYVVAMEIECAKCGLGLNAEAKSRSGVISGRYNVVKVEPCAKCTADAINNSQGRK
jgi:hypothetical protein